jgi:NOL1/NOP2/fmu family ribosome biogenesis protein
MQVKFLKREEKLKIKEILKKEYGADLSFENVALFLKENKIFLSSKEIEEKKDDFLKIPFFSLGLFFGELKRNDKILLSLEGGQMVFLTAKKNIASLDEQSLRNFLLGFNVLGAKEINCKEGAFILLNYHDDLVGVGKKKKGYIENLTVKTRRLSQF